MNRVVTSDCDSQDIYIYALNTVFIRERVAQIKKLKLKKCGFEAFKMENSNFTSRLSQIAASGDCIARLFFPVWLVCAMTAEQDKKSFSVKSTCKLPAIPPRKDVSIKTVTGFEMQYAVRDCFFPFHSCVHWVIDRKQCAEYCSSDMKTLNRGMLRWD